jgi:uncharacterized membrane protein HdeD (DUF308 family)
MQNRLFQFFGLFGYILFVFVVNYFLIFEKKNDLIYLFLVLFGILFTIGIIFDYKFFSIIQRKQTKLDSKYNTHIDLSKSYQAAFYLGIISLIGYLFAFFTLNKNSLLLAPIRLAGFGYLVSETISLIALNYPNPQFVARTKN